MDSMLTTAIVAGIAGTVVGFIWYSPGVFGTKWARLSGISMAGSKKGMGQLMVIGLLSMILMAYVLSYFMMATGMTDVNGGIGIGFKAWLGFLATVLLGSVLWERKPVELYVLNALHWLVVLLVMGAVIGWM